MERIRMEKSAKTEKLFRFIEIKEKLEKDRNKSPEEIERELKEIVEEAATAEVKFTVGKKIKLYQNNPNSISLSFKKCSFDI